MQSCNVLIAQPKNSQYRLYRLDYNVLPKPTTRPSIFLQDEPLLKCSVSEVASD